MWPIAADVACSMVYVSVMFMPVLGTRESCAKMVDIVDMSYGELTHKGPRNHILDVGPHPPRVGALLVRPARAK